MAKDDEWIRTLPRSIRRRFDSMGKYIRGVLDEAGLSERLHRRDIETIHITVFVRVLDEFLRDGTDAAVAAVDTLSELGVEGFVIGRERFSGRNDAVTRGELLANGLRSRTAGMIPADSGDRETSSVTHMVIKLGKELASRGRRMGRGR